MTLLIWSAQVLLLVAAGSLAVLTLGHARSRLIFWQALLAMLLLLPLVEPWQSSPIVVVKIEPETAAVSPDAAVLAKHGFHWRPEDWLLLIAAGAALRLIWIAVGFLRLRNYRKRATLLTEAPIRFAPPTVRWYASDSIPGPVTYGWLRPSILLPARVIELPSALREAIAAHELIHVRRRDWLFVLAEEAIRTVLWFHPAVWFVLSRIQLAREQVVDSEVVHLMQDRDCYLHALVTVAAQKLQPGLDPDLAAAPLFLRKRHLAARVAAVLKEVSMSRTRIAVGLTAVVSTMLLAARVAVWFVPFVSPAQTVMDDPGVTVNAGGTLMHRAPVHHPAGAVGTVTLEATLNIKGEVTDARVLSGPEELRKDALTSVLQWHYSPGVSRVQISIRFDPTAATTSAAPAPAAVPGGRAGAKNAVGGVVGGTTTGTIKNIEFAGFSPEAEQELRSRIALREGDSFTPADRAKVAEIMKEFDSHAMLSVIMRPIAAGGNEVTLRIGLAPQMNAAMAPPPPPPPPPTGAPAISAPQRIGGQVAAANKISNVVPIYPALAKSARIQGDVIFNVLIGKDGTVEDIQLVSGHQLLVQAATDAVKQWVYKPMLLNGEPVEVQTDVTVHFTLSQ